MRNNNSAEVTNTTVGLLNDALDDDLVRHPGSLEASAAEQLDPLQNKPTTQPPLMAGQSSPRMESHEESFPETSEHESTIDLALTTAEIFRVATMNRQLYSFQKASDGIPFNGPYTLHRTNEVFELTVITTCTTIYYTWNDSVAQVPFTKVLGQNPDYSVSTIALLSHISMLLLKELMNTASDNLRWSEKRFQLPLFTRLSNYPFNRLSVYPFNRLAATLYISM
jgi:hypothetical protein